MIFRLEYKNKKKVQARLDITTPGSSIVEIIEGTEQPFLLSYKGDKSDKSLNFLTSSAEINIYETTDFNIDKLKTSNETQIKVDYYIDGSLYWTGFVIPDFFSREIGGAGVVSMVASDRVSTLKGVTLSDLPSMVSIRELAVQCLAKTGLDLPLKTMADFQHGSNIDGFFTSQIASQRLTDNKGRSISCYDVLKSISVASNSRLEQAGGEWRITNKLQHELGTGRLYSGNSTFTNYLESVFNFNEITKGAMRSIVPVAGSVGIYHEHGGGKLHPNNYDFSQGLTGWTPVGGFIADTDNREIKEYKVLGGIYTPQYGEATGKNYLVNANAYQRNINPIYFESEAISVPYSGAGSINVDFDINGVGPMTYPNASKTVLRVAIIAEKGSELLTLHHGGKFDSMPSTNPPVFEKRFEAGFVNQDLTTQADTKSMRVSGTLESDELDGWSIRVRIYGSGSSTPVMINAASIQMKSSQDIPKGVIFKTDQGADFTKVHDIETTIFGDYLTKGLDGYFYDYPIDDTSSLYQGGEFTSLWETPFVAGEAGEFNLLHHSVRQRRRMFSVAHDLISGEIEMEMFNPLSIFVDCNGNRYVVVSAEFDFLRSVVKVDLEEIAYANLTVRDFIYSYFGEGESGISSVGGIQAGSGGGSGGGMTADQLNILNNLASWWKLDDDGNLFTELNVYSEKEVSAYGIGSGGSGGGGIIETVYGYSDLGQTFNNDTLTDTFNAYTINQINNRLLSVEGGSATSVSVTGTGDVIVGGSKSGNVITLTKGNQSWANLTGKPSTFTPSAHAHNASDINAGVLNIARIPTGTTSSTVALGNDSRIVNGQTAFGWGNHASAGYALNSSFNNYLPLTGGTLSGNVTAPTFIGTLSGNASSAAKLQTARTIWGQSFDGTGNVTGALSGATTGVFSSNITSNSGISSFYDLSISGVSGAAAGVSSSGLTFRGFGVAHASINWMPNERTFRFSTGDFPRDINDVYGPANIEATGTIKATTAILTNLTANYLPKHTANGLINSLIYDDGTNVGIGTTSPSVKLHVAGTILATGEITAYVASDRRLKENIKPITSALDYINKLNPVSYNWNARALELNSNKSTSLDYGLIAQEVEEVLPNIVHGIFDDKYKSIDYIKLIPIMIGAIRDLKQKIENI